MRRKKAMKAPFVVTVSAAAAAVSLIAGCNGLVTGDDPSISTNPPEPPTREPVYNPPAPQQPCPEAEPHEGSACVGWTPSSCTYKDLCPTRPSDASPSRIYQCSSGQWKRTSATYVAACPADMPQHGDSCASCADELPADCKYLEGSGCPPALAKCDPLTKTWSVAISSCNPPPPDAGMGD